MDKSDAFKSYRRLCFQLLAKKGKTNKISYIRSDYCKEFENHLFIEFCHNLKIMCEFSSPKTSKQNKVVERENRTLVEMARVTLNSKGMSAR